MINKTYIAGEKIEEGSTVYFNKETKKLMLANKTIFDASWPLSKKRVKIYTGEIIEGCEEWYYHYTQTDVKDFIQKLKQRLHLVNTVDDEFIENMNKRLIRRIDKLAGEELIK